MADGSSVQCYKCKGYGHIQRSCPRTQCFTCKRFGHIRAYCPVTNQQVPQTPGRRQESSSKGTSGAQLQTRQSEKTPASASVSASKAPCSLKVTSFFQQYPMAGERPWLGLSHSGSKSAFPTCRDSSTPPPSPFRTQHTFLPPMNKDYRSNIRSAETVKRVADTIYQTIGDNGGDSLQIFVNKQFKDFHQDIGIQLLCFPKGEADLKKGDFDIIIVCRGGYVYVEVKAFGDAQEGLDEAKKGAKMVERLEGAVGELQKGRRALRYLQPAGESVKIVTTLALPNVTRQYVSSILEQDSQLLWKLAECMTGETRAEVSVEDLMLLILCADDLPPKDGVVDVSNVRVSTAITTWWSAITRIGASTPLSWVAYRLILASFFNKEDVKDFTERVQNIGEKFMKPQLDERQVSIASSGKRYVYITGPPGSGKTLVLAEKSAQWLRDGQSVFVLFAHKTITNQPATEFLWHFIHAILSSYPEMSRLHKIDISNFGRSDDVLTEILKIRDNPGLGKMPRRPTHKPEDVNFEEIKRTSVKLDRVFSPAALKITPKTEIDASTEIGEDICIVIDEFHMRTVCGETSNLLKTIKKRFPAAKIWCAGPFRGHQPAKFFCTEELFLPYRCPPKTQKVLQALEPFCRNEEQHEFSYVTSSTLVPSAGMAPRPEYQYRLPEDGPDPVFFSHADHGPGEITDCQKCAQTLSDYLKHDLMIGHKGRGGKPGLQESEVLIVVSSTRLFNNMQSLRHSEMFRQLISEYSNVNIYGILDTYRLEQPGLCIMHARLVAGMEKKVVVSIPCRQYQHQARAMTYAEAVRRPVASGDPSGRGQRGGGDAVPGPSPSAPGQRTPQTQHPSGPLLPAQGQSESVPRPSPGPPDPAQGHQGQGQSGQNPNPTAPAQGHQGQSTQNPNPTAPAERHQGQSVQTPNPTAPAQEQERARNHPSPGPPAQSLLHGQSGPSPSPSASPSPAALAHAGEQGRHWQPNPDATVPAADRVPPMRDAATAADHGSNIVLQAEINDFLQRCPTLTQSQRERLCRLGRLNLHWLWYSASRSLAHNVIFHF